ATPYSLLPISRGKIVSTYTKNSFGLCGGVDSMGSWCICNTQQAIVPGHKVVVVRHQSRLLCVALLLLDDPTLEIGVVFVHDIVKVIVELVVLPGKAFHVGIDRAVDRERALWREIVLRFLGVSKSRQIPIS